MTALFPPRSTTAFFSIPFLGQCFLLVFLTFNPLLFLPFVLFLDRFLIPATISLLHPRLKLLLSVFIEAFIAASEFISVTVVVAAAFYYDVGSASFFLQRIHSYGGLCFASCCNDRVSFLFSRCCNVAGAVEKQISVTPLPLCRLSSSLFRCSQRNRCERADEPYRFAASLNQCVKATVYPDSIAVSEPSVPVSLHTPTHGTQNTPQSRPAACILDNEKSAPIYIFPAHITEAERFKRSRIAVSPSLDCG